MIIFYDLETTGKEVDSARIVQISAIKCTDDLAQVVDSKNVLVNPGMPIPPEVTEIHGITDEMVKNKPTFKQYAKGVFEFFDGCMLGGFNILDYDVPVLAEEFVRAKMPVWPAKGTLFIDAYQIFAIKEKRDLAGAVKFYCKTEHKDAHDAAADNLATINVFRAQIKAYPDIIVDGWEGLHTFCQGEQPRVDLAGKIRLNKDGQAVYGFGKDKGKVVKDNPGFGIWMLKQSFPTDTKNVVRKILFIDK